MRLRTPRPFVVDTLIALAMTAVAMLLGHVSRAAQGWPEPDGRAHAPERLLAAVAAVDGGDALFAPSVTRRLIEAFARQHGPAQDGAPPDLGVLTSREVEVLKLTARGLSNLEIADRLCISEATVKTHLNRTMTKLDLDSRAQAVVIAYETGLVIPGG